MEGFLLINKPAGISSARCITYIKRILGMKKGIGHAGTLDPFAQGLLIVGIGRNATRLLPTIMMQSKKYKAVATLGILTDTLDITGTIVKTSEKIIAYHELQQAVASFGDAYKQIPPIYSALKYQGKRLYQLARGQNMSDEELHAIAAQKERIVQLHDLSIMNITFPQFQIIAHVSHGTYIRSLVNDIAQKIGTYARTDQLIRTAIGNWNIDQAIPLDELKTRDDIVQNLIVIDQKL